MLLTFSLDVVVERLKLPSPGIDVNNASRIHYFEKQTNILCNRIKPNDAVFVNSAISILKGELKKKEMFTELFFNVIACAMKNNNVNMTLDDVKNIDNTPLWW